MSNNACTQIFQNGRLLDELDNLRKAAQRKLVGSSDDVHHPMMIRCNKKKVSRFKGSIAVLTGNVLLHGHSKLEIDRVSIATFTANVPNCGFHERRVRGRCLHSVNNGYALIESQHASDLMNSDKVRFILDTARYLAFPPSKRHGERHSHRTNLTSFELQTECRPNRSEQPAHRTQCSPAK